MLRGNMDAWPDAGIKFVGILAYIIEAVLLVSLLQRLEDREKFNSFLYFILITAAINTMFVLLQLFFSSAGIPLTRLFVEGHILEGDIATGFFKRAHGIYFSPIILAAVTSFMLAVFAGYAIKKRKIPFHYYIAAILIGIIGLFSYTKTAVLGYPVLLVISLMFYGGLAVYTFIKKKVVAFLIVCVFAFASLAGDALVYTALLPFFALALNLTENKGGKRYYLKPNAVRHELTDDNANT
jgi:hypothetical protein